MLTYKGPTAVTNRENKLTGFKKNLDDLEIAPIITTTIIGSLRHFYNDTNPSVYSFDHVDFGGDISCRGFIEDQADISWTNFLCGRWSVKWKETQTRHYLQINKGKLARSWTIVILEKLLLIQGDMQQI